MEDRQQKAVLALSLLAAFADGDKDERERAQIRRICESLGPGAALDLPGLYQEVLLGRTSVEDAAAALDTPELRQLAYETAVCVCDADGARSEAERAFLDRLVTALGLERRQAEAFAATADELAAIPPASGLPALPAAVVIPPPPPAPLSSTPAATPELDAMILNYSILNGALELLPQSLASMAILPLQVKMVYRVGKHHGYELDSAHIKDFAATLGIGLTGQYVEQMGRKLLGGLLKKVGGGLLGGLGGKAVGSAFSFATTYALGQVAKTYYAGGRTIQVEPLKSMFSSLLEQGRNLQGRYSGEIQQKAQTLDMGQLVNLVRQG